MRYGAGSQSQLLDLINIMALGIGSEEFVLQSSVKWLMYERGLGGAEQIRLTKLSAGLSVAEGKDG